MCLRGYSYMSKRLTGNRHVSFISDKNFIFVDCILLHSHNFLRHFDCVFDVPKKPRQPTKRQIIVVVWSLWGIAMCLLLSSDGAFNREQEEREEEKERDVTPWDLTAPFHGFCSVKVIWYYNESALLALRHYPCSRSARDRELIDRGHLLITTTLSRVCRSFVQAVTQSRSASKVNT